MINKISLYFVLLKIGKKSVKFFVCKEKSFSFQILEKGSLGQKILIKDPTDMDNRVGEK